MSTNLGAIQRRLSGIQDSRSTKGIFSRGSNVYNGGTSAANNQQGTLTGGNTQSKFNAPSQQGQSGQFGISDRPAGFNFGENRTSFEGGQGGSISGGSISDTIQNIRDRASNRFGQDQEVSIPQPVEENQPDAWGFDPRYEEGMSQIRENLANLESERRQAEQRLQEDRERAERRLGIFRDDSLEANTQGMADRGLVHSGINIQQQADIGEQYLQQLEDIGQIDSRTRADLERQFAGQRQQMIGMQRQLEAERAEREAARQRERSMWDAINATPTPTPSGRYDLSDIDITDRGRETVAGDKTGADNTYMDDPNRLAQRIEDIFTNRNVPIYSREETDAQRIARIVQEVASGQRSLNDVRRSVDLIAGNMNL